ncbi:hypothetical protein EVAR_87361_1 [Eumeta japonica]|uniref:Uncharacterized protein n=1 Tax=Eumeta variegata TaxID=151549 RepID=A0A4C1Y2P8_EUMVA|nr:hypothetical protein EVAR_87361_1 [Eumeta japonica]
MDISGWDLHRAEAAAHHVKQICPETTSFAGGARLAVAQWPENTSRTTCIAAPAPPPSALGPRPRTRDRYFPFLRRFPKHFATSLHKRKFTNDFMCE